MRKTCCLMIFLVFLSITVINCTAENISSQINFDWSDYSYEELLVIQDQLNEVIREKQKEWAIKNGNRRIQLDLEEFNVYISRTQTIMPIVERLTDDSPDTTNLVWTSSDESVARVSAYGVVTGISHGDAEIICSAKDDENIFARAIVHVILPVINISLSEKQTQLLISSDTNTGKIKLNAIIEPENAFCTTVSWTSSTTLFI